MNLLNRVFRAILWGVVTGGLLSFAQKWTTPDAARVTPGGQQPQKPPHKVRLHRDPVCGTYVSPEISLKLERSGQITHFCSAQCRDRYARPAANAAGA